MTDNVNPSQINSIFTNTVPQHAKCQSTWPRRLRSFSPQAASRAVNTHFYYLPRTLCCSLVFSLPQDSIKYLFIYTSNHHSHRSSRLTNHFRVINWHILPKDSQKLLFWPEFCSDYTSMSANLVSRMASMYLIGNMCYRHAEICITPGSRVHQN